MCSYGAIAKYAKQRIVAGLKEGQNSVGNYLNSLGLMESREEISDEWGINAFS